NRRELALKRQGVKLTQLSREGHLLPERTEDGTADDMVANPLSRAYGKRPLSAELRKLPSTPKVDASPVKERYSMNEMDAPSFRSGRRSRNTSYDVLLCRKSGKFIRYNFVILYKVKKHDFVKKP
ncbi:MAG: hypothetical protein KGY66_06740, partial [Candidatus Thermoplasmatota archaeon]|nr:hypothetical protein [Candidatus Thermoplasmatota archaeon]